MKTKAGMKRLVDSVVKKLPSIFHHQLDKFEKASNVRSTCHVIPVIELVDIDKDPTKCQGLIDMVKETCETIGTQLEGYNLPEEIPEPCNQRRSDRDPTNKVKDNLREVGGPITRSKTKIMKQSLPDLSLEIKESLEQSESEVAVRIKFLLVPTFKTIHL
ncbi:hypothetical protein CR513_45483, partial [Mucuna pruriens]